MGVLAGLSFSELPGWIDLKLSSGRAKDRTHVVEVLKNLGDSQIAAIRKHPAGVHALYSTLLDQLITDADGEKRQEQVRGKQRQ